MAVPGRDVRADAEAETMSYNGRIHDAVWELFEERIPEVPWKKRSALVDELLTVILPIFEGDVRHYERYRIAARLASLLELPVEAVEKTADRTDPRHD